MIPLKLKQNKDRRSELPLSCIGLQQSVQQELFHNPSGSASQSLTEHPDVSVEAARANLMVAASKSRSIAKELSNAAARLEFLQLNIAALPKEEKKSVIKEIRKVKEKMSRLEEVLALADEHIAKEEDNTARALLRHGV